MEGYEQRRRALVGTYESIRALIVQKVAVWRVVCLLEASREPSSTEEEREAYLRRVDEEFFRVCGQMAVELDRLSMTERYHLSLLEREGGAMESLEAVERRMMAS
jgi:hypothetical protein